MARMSFAYILSVLMVAVAASSGGDRGATSTTSSALTGPSFVDETNINSVADLAEAGTR